MITSEEKEMLRHAALEVLTVRHPAALAIDGVHRRVAYQLDFKAAIGDVESALEFWKSQGYASFNYDAAGSTKYWQATASGVLFIERRA
jgi:hypothetical protein